MLSSSLKRRTQPSVPCPHYPRCFGCPFIDLSYPEQLDRKRQRIVDAVRSYPKLADIDIPPVNPSPRQLGYRARVKLVVRRTKDAVMTGLYIPRTHRVIDISSCPVHPKPVNTVLHYLKQKIIHLAIAPYDERSDSGQLRYLDFRYSFARREMQLTFVTRKAEFAQGRRLADSLTRRFPFITGIIQNINQERGNVIWGRQSRMLAGHDLLVESLDGLKLGYPAAAFSQANPFTAASVYQKVVQLASLNGRETVLDLYCGAGPIALSLARFVRFVWGVDDDAAAIEAAEENARRNGMSNCRFVAAEVPQGIREAGRHVSAVDLMVLNPPRKGILPSAMDAILNVRPRRVIYVACDPESLARDLHRFTSGGYSVTRVEVFDMFPQTREVETVALLTR